MVNRTCKIVDFPPNCEMETVATCSTTNGNGSCHGLEPSFFDDITRRRRQILTSDDQKSLMVDQKSAIYVCLR